MPGLALLLGGALVQLSLRLGQALPRGLKLTALFLQLQALGLAQINLGLRCRDDRL